VLPDKSEVTIMVNSGTRYLELSANNVIIGHCNIYSDPDDLQNISSKEDIVQPSIEPALYSLSKTDIYDEFRYRGYEYSAPFKNLERVIIKDGGKCLT